MISLFGIQFCLMYYVLDEKLRKSFHNNRVINNIINEDHIINHGDTILNLNYLFYQGPTLSYVLWRKKNYTVCTTFRFLKTSLATWHREKIKV